MTDEWKVYLALCHDEDGIPWVKVGISHDPIGRAYELDGYKGRRLHELYESDCTFTNEFDAYDAEHEILFLLRAFRDSGEWLKFKPKHHWLHKNLFTIADKAVSRHSHTEASMVRPPSIAIKFQANFGNA